MKRFSPLTPNHLAQRAHLISKDACLLFEVASIAHFVTSAFIFPLFALFENKENSEKTSYQTFLEEAQKKAQTQLQNLGEEKAEYTHLLSFLNASNLQKEPVTTEDTNQFFQMLIDKMDQVKSCKNEKVILPVEDFCFSMLAYLFIRDMTYYLSLVKTFVTEKLKPLEKLFSYYFTLTNLPILASFTQLLYGSSLLYLAYLSFLAPANYTLLILLGELFSMLCLQSDSFRKGISPIVNALFYAYFFFTFSFSISYALFVLKIFLQSSSNKLLSTNNTPNNLIMTLAPYIKLSFELAEKIVSQLESTK